MKSVPRTTVAKNNTIFEDKTQILSALNNVTANTATKPTQVTLNGSGKKGIQTPVNSLPTTPNTSPGNSNNTVTPTKTPGKNASSPSKSVSNTLKTPLTPIKTGHNLNTLKNLWTPTKPIPSTILKKSSTIPKASNPVLPPTSKGTLVATANVGSTQAKLSTLKSNRSTKSTPSRINRSVQSSTETQKPSKRRASQPDLISTSASVKLPHIPADQKIDVSHVRPRIGSLDNIKYTPKVGGEKKIFSAKPDFSKVKSRVGSLDNIKHTPKASKEGSLDTLPPKGGEVKVFSKKPNFSSVQSRIGSLENINYVPQGGNIQIFSDKITFKNVKARVGSLDNIQYTPGGGDVAIYNEKLKFRETAAPKIDAGISNSSNQSVSSSFLDDERMALVDSPVSSLALDEVPESNSPTNEIMSIAPFRIALSPIAEVLQSSQEDEQEHQTITQLLSPPLVPKKAIIENKTILVKGKPAPASAEKREPEAAEIFPGQILENKDKTYLVKETPNTVKAKIAELEAKNAASAAKKLAAKEEIKKASIQAKLNAAREAEEKFLMFVQNLQKEFGRAETVKLDVDEGGSQVYQPEQIYDDYEEEEDSECPPDDTDSTFENNLSFEVNVLRKSRLVAEANLREYESLYLPEITSVIEVPPKSFSNPTKPELTIAQKNIYESSWI
ncbi:hypothetical protein G9A89_018515 [Geosiphon pyriformis]|nr:hypothetical protein G9A89_018515 [Geosiphon pyriformis]